ncbi:hypothetical protein TVNIR_1382 [Thioalkalivibrio nitratireducens DSM 14787]|uniref:FecR protein domain-containing protein n=1 Tax=Thioalkalivibrio nitratireducens (strain DSM 14787 / UNIQEM 213 / ALEN2) TaxID=1255043 RepID=L0DVJ4_THIND|nr:hypothetical protein [Thioalkalivibrio nitratireducens]AGA33053.1 hypothetical protein TVNIR_1382 [Thioalkalivibrio nitratireducens DSM 14787]
MKTKLTSGLMGFAFIGLTLAASGPALAGSIGDLVAHDTVRISQQGSEGSINVSSTRYAWYSGDRIDTRNGRAVLDLDAGASVGFAAQTRASLALEGNRIRANLDAGSLLYAIPEPGLSLHVSSGPYEFSTTGDGEIVQVSGSGSGSFGMIQRLDDGQLKVTVREGTVTARDASGNVYYRVGAGERVTFSADEPGLIQAQVEAADPGAAGAAGGGAGAIGRGLGLAFLGGGLAVVGGSAAASSTSDPDPVSP